MYRAHPCSVSTRPTLARSTHVDWQHNRVRHAKSRIDSRLSELFRSADNGTVEAALWQLVHVVRQRSGLLDPRGLPKSGEPQVEALLNLAGFAEQFLREPADWPGCDGSAYDVVASLAQFLLGRYPVPRVLCSVWFGDRSELALRRRNWFVAHAGGRKLRDLDIPLQLTRQMERHFLSSPHHLTVEQALRRAEGMGLGASPDHALRIAMTRMGREMANPGFWRTMAHFFVKVEEQIDVADIGPIVDFVYAVRFQRTECLGANGIEYIEPPHPDFSIKGRSLQSVLRLVEQWHKSLGVGSGGTWTWDRSRYEPLMIRKPHDEGVDTWEFVELLSSKELAHEGVAMQHCVSSYAEGCFRGWSRIWSLRKRRDDRQRSILTIEIHPQRGEIVQVRGLRNRLPHGEPLAYVKQWARREGLSIVRQAIA